MHASWPWLPKEVRGESFLLYSPHKDFPLQVVLRILMSRLNITRLPFTECLLFVSAALIFTQPVGQPLASVYGKGNKVRKG